MISVVVPAYNEEGAIQQTLQEVHDALSGGEPFEIIVVNDGSTDGTLAKLQACTVPAVRIVNHVENLGYGRSLFDGIEQARYSAVAIIDADGSYSAHQIRQLAAHFPAYDMVVGSRCGPEYRRGMFKRPARLMFKFLVEYACGRAVPDVNSGLRIFRRDVAIRFQHSLCTGFSFTTTLTLIFHLNQYFVKYVPIEYRKRTGASKVNHFRDTLRAGQIIVEAFLFYNPIKLFLLLAWFNVLLGLGLEAANALLFHSTFLEITAALCTASFVPVFALGLVAAKLKRVSNLMQGGISVRRGNLAELAAGPRTRRTDVREKPSVVTASGPTQDGDA